MGLIAAVHSPGGCVVGGLQSKLNADGLYAVEFFQKRDDVLRQAVWPGADGKPHYEVRFYGLTKQSLQLFHRGIGASEGLKVGNIFSGFAFGFDPLFGKLQLVFDAAADALGKLTASGAGAEGTAAGTQMAVPVGTGEAAVQRQLIYLAAEKLPVIVVGSTHGDPPKRNVEVVLEYLETKANATGEMRKTPYL